VLILKLNVDIASPYRLLTMMTFFARRQRLVLAALLVALSFAKVMPSLEKDRGGNTIGSMLQVLYYNCPFFSIPTLFLK
jgi:hypothetical protein